MYKTTCRTRVSRLEKGNTGLGVFALSSAHTRIILLHTRQEIYIRGVYMQRHRSTARTEAGGFANTNTTTTETNTNGISAMELRRTVCDAFFDADPTFALSSDRWFPLTDYSSGILSHPDILLAPELVNPQQWHRKAKEIRSRFLHEHGVASSASGSRSARASPWISFPVSHLTAKGASFPWKFNNAFIVTKLLKQNRHNFIFEAKLCVGKQQHECVLKCCRLFSPTDVLPTQQQSYRAAPPMTTTVVPRTDAATGLMNNAPPNNVHVQQQQQAPQQQQQQPYYPGAHPPHQQQYRDYERDGAGAGGGPKARPVQNNKEDKIRALVHTTGETVFIAQPWMEIISWALLYPEHFYGHCNVRDPVTKAYYVLLFIPRFHSVLLQLTRSTLRAHDEMGRRILAAAPPHQQHQPSAVAPVLMTSHYPQQQQQQQYLPGMQYPGSSQAFPVAQHQYPYAHPATIHTYPPSVAETHVPPHARPSTQSIHWADILHAAVTQIMLVTLVPLKERFRMCHNDFKSDNVAYVRTHKKWHYVRVKSHYDANASVVLRIPTYGREFVLIDFGFTYLECSGDHYCSISPVENITTGMIFSNPYTDTAQLAYSLLREFLMVWPNAFYHYVMLNGAAPDAPPLERPWVEFMCFLRDVASTDLGELVAIDTERWAEPMYADVSAHCTERKWDFVMPLLIQKYATETTAMDDIHDDDKTVVDFIWPGVDAFMAPAMSSSSMVSASDSTTTTTTAVIASSNTASKSATVPTRTISSSSGSTSGSSSNT